MNKVKLSLSTIYDITPSYLQVECQGEVIYAGELTKNIVIEHETGRPGNFEIKIKKTGKTKEVVDMKGRQEVVVESINLNGIDLKIEEFGSFSLKDNPYVTEETLQTTKLNLNGEWTFGLLKTNLIGDITY